MLRLFLLLVCFWMLCFPANAVESVRYDGNALIEDCEGEYFQAVACASFIEGIFHGSLSTTTALKVKPVFCLPAVYSNRLIRDSVLAWIRKNPKFHFMDAHSLVFGALRKQYPCSNN